MTTHTPTPSSPPKAIPEINILLLGAPNIGKKTFLQSLPHVRDGALQKPSSSHTLLPPTEPPTLPWPSTFSVTLFNRPYTINIYSSTTPLFTDPFPDKPSLTILAYAIDSRLSLANTTYWHAQCRQRHADETPLILLGLKRDLRSEQCDEQGELVCVMPAEGVKMATQLRCDKYVECSARTGELLWEVLEDVTRVAALTTTEKREEVSCTAM